MDTHSKLDGRGNVYLRERLDPHRLRHATGRRIGWRRPDNIPVTTQHPPARHLPVLVKRAAE